MDAAGTEGGRGGQDGGLLPGRPTGRAARGSGSRPSAPPCPPSSRAGAPRWPSSSRSRAGAAATGPSCPRHGRLPALRRHPGDRQARPAEPRRRVPPGPARRRDRVRRLRPARRQPADGRDHGDGGEDEAERISARVTATHGEPGRERQVDGGDRVVGIGVGGRRRISSWLKARYLRQHPVDCRRLADPADDCPCSCGRRTCVPT